jgi:condensin-2 complex subunit D3
MTTNDQPTNGDPTNDDDSHPPPPPPPQSINASIDRAVRAHAIIALGKLCIIDEMLAKRCVPVLVRQLQSNDDHIVRNNIVVVISDLCIRYVDFH